MGSATHIKRAASCACGLARASLPILAFPITKTTTHSEITSDGTIIFSFDTSRCLNPE